MQINGNKKGWPEPSFYLSSAFYGMAYSKVAPKIIICLGKRCQRKKGEGGNVFPFLLHQFQFLFCLCNSPNGEFKLGILLLQQF